MRAALFQKNPQKVLEISAFSGEHRGKIANGQLMDTNNVTVLSGGAIYSMLDERNIDVNTAYPSLNEGVYTLCEYYDAEYETKVSQEWIYKNICPKEILSYVPELNSTV